MVDFDSSDLYYNSQIKSNTIEIRDNNTNIIVIRDNSTNEILRIAPDGKLFWNGREVETDDDFRAAMLELAALFKRNMV